MSCTQGYGAWRLVILLQDERKDVDRVQKAPRAAIEADPEHDNAHSNLATC